jgi:hypothetical protein
MSKHRDFSTGDQLPAGWLDALNELLGTMVSRNLRITSANATTLQVVAAPGNGQVGLSITGKWRFNSATITAAAPANAAGTYPIYFTSRVNNDAQEDAGTFDYSFGMKLSTVPSGSGAEAIFRSAGEYTWDGSVITSWWLDPQYPLDQQAGPDWVPGDLKHSLQAADHGGWALCDGRSILRALYPALFAIIGTTYGAADGGHFNLPDYRGRSLYGKGTHTEVDSFADNDGLSVANRRAKHQHFVPWPFAENGGGGNFISAIRSGAAALSTMGYALRDRITDNSINEKTGPISKLSGGSVPGDATSAMVNAGYGFNGAPWQDIAAYRDVGSDFQNGGYAVSNIFIRTS